MPNVFISYHHANDQSYKDSLVKFATENKIFSDVSVNTGDISDALDDQAIRAKIRDEYLQDSTVTLVLVGTGTKGRKHVDWEIYSSMFDGAKNKKSGVLAITLPSTNCTYFTAAHGDEEKKLIHPEVQGWTSLANRSDYEDRYPYLPERLVDNLHHGKGRISVVPWAKINASSLSFLVNATHNNRASTEYDLSRAMRRRDS
jgi:hypothetical protein